MGGLWLPPASRELSEKTAEHTAQVLRMVQRCRGTMDYWTRVLREEVDPRLELIFAPADAQAVGLIPGRYHVLAQMPGQPPALFPVTGPDGEFVEPTHAMVRMLKEMDLQNPTALREREAREARREADRERERARETEQRHDELNERWAAVSRTQISTHRPSYGYAQNVAGIRRPGGRKAA